MVSYLPPSRRPKPPQLYGPFHGLLYAQTQALAVSEDAFPQYLTGWAQINGRDELPIPQKVELDAEYLRRRSFLFDIRILVGTLLSVLARKGITH